MLKSMDHVKKPRVILVIDDDQTMLLGLQTLLTRNKYNVTICEDSPSSIQLAGESQPDLIICDIMMPKMDGFKIREAIASNAATKDIPFLFLSARDTQSDKLRGFQEGVDDFITKPFDPEELLARIHAIFRSQERDQEKVLREMSRQIERLQSEVSQNLSDGIQAPISQILLSLETILREKYHDPERLEQYVETVTTQSNRLNMLANDLKFLNAYENGSILYMRQVVDIQNDFILPIQQREELYKGKDLRVKVQISDGIMIHAPKKEFTHVVIHLVDNAMKFAPPKSSILIDLAANGEGGCVLTVSDHGPGIPVEQREKVFDRYYQVSQKDTADPEGLGLGLTVARPITRSLGGDVIILPDEHRCLVQMVLPPAPFDI
jgi:DNA-binding response OmpR family regulator